MSEIVSAEEKKKILDRVEQRAASYLYEYVGCAQCVLLALQEEFDFPGGLGAVKASSFNGAGIARMGEACGILIGCIMALALASGRENLEDPPFPEPGVVDEATGLPKSLVRVRNFYQRAVEMLGDNTCRGLQAKWFGKVYDLVNPEEYKEFSEVSTLKLSLIHI
mgnify:CR=1 FL=1